MENLLNKVKEFSDYLLIKSIIWNINYYIKKNKKNDK